MYDAYGHAAALKINVLRRPLESVHGLWLPDENTIVLRAGLCPHREREVLAHEIGHAVAGHDSDSPANEAAADLYAARRLICSHRDYTAAILSTRNLLEAAKALQVTTRILYAYINDSVAPTTPTALALPFRAVGDCRDFCNLE